MGMVRLVGMSLLVFVWVDLCGRMMKIGWKDGASMRVMRSIGAEKERGLLWMVFFSCEQRWRFSLEGCRFYLFFSFCELFVS